VDQIWNPTNRMKGVRSAKTKRELKMVKKAAPRGDAKNSATKIPVPIVGRMDLRSSNGPLGGGGS
jgi:hypothetical protein